MATVPEQIGKYKILSVVAVGGMGTVYKAMHPSLKRQVIIKKLTLKSGSSSIRERFKREAQILLDLSSRYIVRMFDYFTEGRSDYIVLEYVNGMSLDRLIEKNGPMPPQLAMLIFLDACRGLQSAHSAEIVHRDIKPGNILISLRGEVKLADFGIAGSEKDRGDSAKNDEPTVVASGLGPITMVGSSMGTPAYMSPEQFDDSSSVDKRADIYSMGVMLYELVTGKRPYSGDMNPKSIQKIKKGDFIPPEKLDKTLPRSVCSLIKKMMRPNPAKRYQSIAPVIAKVQRYLRPYNQHEIRLDLARAIRPDRKFTYPVYQKKNPVMRKVLYRVGTTLGILILVILFWKQGVFHASILRPFYTPIFLSMEIPATASADSDIPARAFFFVNDNDRIPEVMGSRRVFSVASSQNATMRLSTKTVYLRPGSYRVKVVEGPYVWWQSIEIGKTPVHLDLDFLKDVKRGILIHTAAFDAETGEDISAKTRFLVQLNGDWFDISRLRAGNLTTGSVYRILAVSNGYKDEYFGLRLDWYQDELFISSSLHKKE